MRRTIKTNVCNVNEIDREKVSFMVEFCWRWPSRQVERDCSFWGQVHLILHRGNQNEFRQIILTPFFLKQMNLTPFFLPCFLNFTTMSGQCRNARVDPSPSTSMRFNIEQPDQIQANRRPRRLRRKFRVSFIWSSLLPQTLRPSNQLADSGNRQAEFGRKRRHRQTALGVSPAQGLVAV